MHVSLNKKPSTWTISGKTYVCPSWSGNELGSWSRGSNMNRNNGWNWESGIKSKSGNNISSVPVFRRIVHCHLTDFPFHSSVKYVRISRWEIAEKVWKKSASVGRLSIRSKKRCWGLVTRYKTSYIFYVVSHLVGPLLWVFKVHAHFTLFIWYKFQQANFL